VVLTAAYLQDVKRPEHVLEGLAEIATSMVIKSEVGVAVSSARVVVSEESLLQNDALGLELNCLEEVSKLELNAGQLSNGSGDISVHRACDLKERVNA
jgi:hypothetical protein